MLSLSEIAQFLLNLLVVQCRNFVNRLCLVVCNLYVVCLLRPSVKAEVM